ncbi:unnamed protein product [Effrenium voratum]|uniref:WW domain-containing protein n=1 Tax=Effrenium voratum TaxID=2562239 RepID=A0AA36HWA9_9DINO|nr:unnamed protein product [Effrenium voratum]
MNGLMHAMVRQWLVELLDFSAEGLENQVLASHATYKALDQVLQVPDLKPIVEALKEAPVVIQGWRVSQSRAGLTFYQTSDGRLTRWTLPVAVVDVRTENVVWTPPKTPPQDDGLMTPPAEKGVAELELQEAAAQTAPLMIVPATPALTLRVPATPMVPMATPTTPARCPPPSLAQTAPAPMLAAARPAAHFPPTPPLPPPPPPPAPPAPPARPALPALPAPAPAEARWSRPPETPQMLAPASPDEGVQRPNEPQKPPKRKAPSS